MSKSQFAGGSCVRVKLDQFILFIVEFKHGSLEVPTPPCASFVAFEEVPIAIDTSDWRKAVFSATHLS